MNNRVRQSVSAFLPKVGIPSGNDSWRGAFPSQLANARYLSIKEYSLVFDPNRPEDVDLEALIASAKALAGSLAGCRFTVPAKTFRQSAH